MEQIPAVWRIDIEPDEFEVSAGQPPWTGFVTMASVVRELRGQLEERTGAPVCLSWFPRFDPEIGRSYGQADFVFDRYRPLFDELQEAGDVFGTHIHYYRWDPRQGAMYSEHTDVDWITHCVDMSAETFEQCFGEPLQRASQGGFFLHDAVVRRSAALGIEVDVTPEPGLGALTDTISFGAYATQPSPDFRGFPRRPYYPSRTALSVPANSWAEAHPMMLVPLTAYDYEGAGLPWIRRIARKIFRRSHSPLNPWKVWADPSAYWDFMERAADEGPARYIAFAVRTDSPSSRAFRQAQDLFEYLPRHPIARRLRFVDPLSPEIRALARAGMTSQTAS